MPEQDTAQDGAAPTDQADAASAAVDAANEALAEGVVEDTDTEDQDEPGEFDLDSRESEALRVYGIGDEETEGMTPEKVKALGTRLADARSQTSRAESRAGNLDRRVQTLEAAESGRTTDHEEPPKPIDGWSDFADDEFEADPAMQHMAKNLQALAGAVASNKKSYSEGVEHADARDAAREDREFDEAFSALDPKFYPGFGTGSMTSYSEDSPEAVARKPAFDRAQMELLLAREKGKTLSVADAVHNAMLVLHGDAVAKEAQAKRRAAIEKRKRGSAATPSGGKTPQADGKTSAIAKVNEALQKMSPTA